MLNDNAKNLCKQSVEVFDEIFCILSMNYPFDYACQIATELTKIVFIAVADV